MHELSIAEGIVKQMTEYLRENPSVRIVKIMLEVGKISGVNPASLEFAFPLALENAQIGSPSLEIIVVPVTIECKDCKAKTKVEQFKLVCGSCSSTAVIICAGRELKIKSLEVVLPEDSDSDGS